MSKRAFGTHDIARICQVTPPTVGRWIEEGKLPSFTTGGGHRRVWDTDLVLFLNAHNIPVPEDLSVSPQIKILIIDDEPAVRRFLIRVLKREWPEADISETGDGFEAGHSISRLLPQLVILDINLPGIDGFRVCQTVRQDPNLKNVKILAITGNSTDSVKKKIMGVGADDFLGKPFGAAEAVEKIAGLLLHV